MCKIKSVSFQNYKAFGDTNCQMELRPITLVVGKNSSGKSSVLKLLSILSSVLGKKDCLLPLRNDDVTVGGIYTDLIHNNENTGLKIEVAYKSGMKFEAEYGINESQLFVYHHEVKNSTENEELGIGVNYIGPIRVPASRNVEIGTLSRSSVVGKDGNKAFSILLNSYLNDKKLFNNVSEWLSKHLEGQGLNFERNSPTSGSYSLYVKHGKAKVNVADVGLGLSQVLPVILQSFIDDGSDILAVEQPALHIHPAAHVDVIERLAFSAKEFNRCCVVETHSKNVLLGVRRMVADKECPITADDVIIYFVDIDGDRALMKPIHVEDDGSLDDWPYGVFGEDYSLLCDIKRHGEQ